LCRTDSLGVPILCLVTLIAGGGFTHGAEAPLRIGLIGSGASADALAAGARVAVDELNASGGIGGRPLHLVRTAVGHPWRGGAGTVARVVFDDDLVGMIGPQDGATAHTVAQIATRRRIPVVTLSPESSLTRAMDPWVLRGVPDDETQAIAMLRWAGAGDRLGVAVPEGRAGRERLDSLQRAAAVTGNRIASLLRVDPDGTIAGAGDYDVLLLWLDAAPALELLAALGPRGLPEQILGSTRLDDASFTRALAVDAGPELAVLRSSLDEHARALAIPLLRPNSTLKRNARSAEPPLAGRLGHDLVYVLAEAARRAGTEPLAIREALHDGSSFAGRSGHFGFDENGNRTGDLRIGWWRRGNWVPEVP